MNRTTLDRVEHSGLIRGEIEPIRASGAEVLHPSAGGVELLDLAVAEHRGDVEIATRIEDDVLGVLAAVSRDVDLLAHIVRIRQIEHSHPGGRKSRRVQVAGTIECSTGGVTAIAGVE